LINNGLDAAWKAGRVRHSWGSFPWGKLGNSQPGFPGVLVPNMASWEIHELAMKVYSWQDHL